jgi:hypothetical protein
VSIIHGGAENGSLLFQQMEDGRTIKTENVLNIEKIVLDGAVNR